MQTITLEEVNSMGFVEKSYRPWMKDEKFMIHSFSSKWIDLLQRKEHSVVYLATIPNDHTMRNLHVLQQTVNSGTSMV